jgi:hypothetical protein
LSVCSCCFCSLALQDELLQHNTNNNSVPYLRVCTRQRGSTSRWEGKLSRSSQMYYLFVQYQDTLKSYTHILAIAPSPASPSLALKSNILLIKRREDQQPKTTITTSQLSIAIQY